MALKEHIENAWNAYKKNFQAIMGAQIVAVAIVFGLLMFVAGGLALSAMPYVAEDGTISDEYTRDIMASPYFMLGCILFVVLVLVALVLRAGLVGIYYDALREKDVKIGTMFLIAKEKYKTVIGAQLFAAAVLLAGMAILFIPAFALFSENLEIMESVIDIEVIILSLFALLFFLINQAVVISADKAIDAVKRSYAIVKGNYIDFFVLALVFFAADLANSYIPDIWIIISLFFIMPLSSLAYTSFYMERVKETKKKKVKKH